MTVNQLMSLMKIVRTKKARLEVIQREISNREKIWMGDQVRENTPQYDPKTIDILISEYEKFLFLADAAIKQSNAVTEIDLDVNQDHLLNPL